MTGNISTTGMIAGAKVSEATLEATIIRADGRIEKLGVIAYYHKNPLRRLIWRVGRWLRGDFI